MHISKDANQESGQVPVTDAHLGQARFNNLNTKFDTAISLLFTEEKSSVVKDVFRFVVSNAPTNELLLPVMSALLAHKSPVIRVYAARYLAKNFKGEGSLSLLAFTAWKKEDNPRVAKCMHQLFMNATGYDSYYYNTLYEKLHCSNYAKQCNLIETKDPNMALMMLHLDKSESIRLFASNFIRKNFTGPEGGRFKELLLLNSAYALSDLKLGFCLSRSRVLSFVEKCEESVISLLPLIRKLQSDSNLLTRVKASLVELLVLKNDSPAALQVTIDALKHIEGEGLLKPLHDIEKYPYRPGKYYELLCWFQRKLIREARSLGVVIEEQEMRNNLQLFSDRVFQVEERAGNAMQHIEDAHSARLEQINSTIGYDLVLTVILNSIDNLPESTRLAVSNKLYQSLYEETRPEVRKVMLISLSIVYSEQIQIEDKLRIYVEEVRDKLKKRIFQGRSSDAASKEYAEFVAQAEKSLNRLSRLRELLEKAKHS